MEGTAATVEQAEPQGSAAQGQDTSAPASGDNGAATPESFGSIYKQHVTERGARIARASASSADRETSAQTEQPAPSSVSASRPGAGASDGDDTAGGGAGSPAGTDQPSLTRAQRKALRTGQQSDGQPSEATTGSNTSPASAGDDNDDPVVARVAQVEQKVTEGLSRLEGLLKPAAPGAAADPSQDGEATAHRDLFGDDAEFARRADIALHGSQRNQFLDQNETDELAVWASNRKARDFSAGRINQQYQSNFSAMVLAAAGEFGLDAASIQKPGTTFRDIFGAFVSQGETKRAAEVTAATEKAAKLEAANRLLADENEALRSQLPASARSVLRGGDAAVSRSAQLADRSKMNGRQLMAAGLTQSMNGRRNRPGAR